MKDRSVYIATALECIDLIKDYISGYTLEAFLEDRKTQDAVVRNLEVIGQALILRQRTGTRHTLEVEVNGIAADLRPTGSIQIARRCLSPSAPIAYAWEITNAKGHFGNLARRHTE